MSAYIIFIRDETLDQDEMEIYAQKAADARGEHPITPLAFYGQAEGLEGPRQRGSCC